MSHWSDKIIRYQQIVLFAGLLFWQAIVVVLEQSATPAWKDYVVALLALGVVQLPAGIFILYKERWREKWSSKRYRLAWLACFSVALPASVIAAMYFRPAGYEPQVFFMAGVSVLSLELLLEINAYYRKRVRHNRWLKRIDVERAILIGIAVVAVALSAMAVSGMDDPSRYNEEGHLLIHPLFSFRAVVAHFGMFIALSIQFLLLYLAGYLFFYLNSRFLVPAVLKRQGLVLYVLTTLALVALLYPLLAQMIIVLPMSDLLGDTIADNAFNTIHIFIAVTINLVSLPVVLAEQWNRQNNRIVSLEKEKAQAELDLLKQQLNPHFFFNTLNNLYALSLQRSEAAPGSILQLSDLMRYVIYKGKEPQVSLEEEVKYLEDYIQLQRIRLRQELDLRFEHQACEGRQLLAPLLLIVFVENAFKHGIEPAEEAAFLHLHLECDDSRLYFRCENSFEPDGPETGGVGLQNLERRLALLYPGKYKLLTEAKNHTFKAELSLELS